MLIEQLGRSQELNSSVSEYVDDLKGELRQIKVIRLVATFISFVVVLVLIGSFVCVVFFDTSWLWASSPYVKAGFILATVAGTITLLAVVLKGAFRSRAERNRDEMLPEHLKVIVDAVNELRNG